MSGGGVRQMVRKHERGTEWKTRIRRELRSLTGDEEAQFVAVMREMVDAGGSSKRLRSARERFGPRFRSYAYLSVKHALAALHPQCDQGHLAANQIVFHRALLLEFEHSLLSVLSVLFPNSTLKALPYWNWVSDVQRQGSMVESSLWRLWGSPFGDPNNRYCVHDPVFNIRVPHYDSNSSSDNDPFAFLLSDRLGPKLGGKLLNGFGLRRSPWNAADCPGLARNPGWVLGAAAPLRSLWEGNRTSQFREAHTCLSSQGFSDFAICMQGLGYTSEGGEFGPHNVPHVFMGTFYDETYGGGLALLLTAALAAGVGVTLGCCILSSVFILGSTGSGNHTSTSGTRSTQTISSPGDKAEKDTVRRQAFGGMAALLFFGAMVCTLTGLTIVRDSMLGVRHVVDHTRWSKLFFNSGPVDFTGSEWRQGRVECPLPESCEVGSDPRACLCFYSKNKMESLLKWPLSLVGLRPGQARFAGSDFWDGAFSSNENFFYPIHAYGDLLHFRWTKHRGANVSNDFGGIAKERTADGCPGTSLGDVISEGMCFTAQDLTGMDNDRMSLNDSDERPLSSMLARSAGQPCATMADIFSFTVCQQEEEQPYTYDVLAEAFTWQALEPWPVQCPSAAELCERESRGVPNVEFIGSVKCHRSVDGAVVENAHCVAIGRPRPHPPVKVCDCKAATFRTKSEALASSSRLTLVESQAVALLSFITVSLSALPCLCCANMIIKSKFGHASYAKVAQQELVQT